METDDRVKAREFTSGTRLDKNQYPRCLKTPSTPALCAPPHIFTHGGCGNAHNKAGVGALLVNIATALSPHFALSIGRLMPCMHRPAI